MVQLQNDLEKIEATHTQVVGISYDSVKVLSRFAKKSGVTFPLLSDPDSKVIKAYGIHHKKGYPHPGTFFVEQDGTVSAAIFLEGYAKRHNSQYLIDSAAEKSK